MCHPEDGLHKEPSMNQIVQGYALSGKLSVYDSLLYLIVFIIGGGRSIQRVGMFYLSLSLSFYREHREY